MAAARSNPIPALELTADASQLLESPVRESLEVSVLPTWLRSQRWFGGKARTIEAAHLMDFVRLPLASPVSFLAWLDVRFSRGANDLYLLPLAVSAHPPADKTAVVARLQTSNGELWLHDALTDSRVCGLLLDLVAREGVLSTSHGDVKCEVTTAFSELRGNPSEELAPQLGPPTSSNSLVFYGDRLLLKLFRRLEIGINPDYEIGRFLTEASRFEYLPRVAGALEYCVPSRHCPITLGIVQQRIVNQGDGWHHALAKLSSYYEHVAARVTKGNGALLSGEESRPNSPSPESEVVKAIQLYARAAKRLGKRTAEMHLALAGGTDEAFAPEPIAAADIDAVRSEILTQAEHALRALHDNLGSLPKEVADDAAELLSKGPAAIERAVRSAQEVPEAMKTRVHGDYHLGQVLWVNGNYVILDFEGEPTRAIDERRQKFSPLRDVAGMLRSYHYAAYAGLFAFVETHPELFSRLLPWAELWQQRISAAFLTEYRNTAGDASFLPKEEADLARLLEGFMLAKALYELSYELNNRPDWVRIPLGGVQALLAKGSGVGER
jgi:maltose alpha-D-glucosyltransferase/alpha-amylase